VINAVFPQEADGDDVLERRRVDNVEPKGRPSNDARSAAVAPSLPPGMMVTSSSAATLTPLSPRVAPRMTRARPPSPPAYLLPSPLL